MKRDKLIDKLKRYDYTYSLRGNHLTIQLDFGQEFVIDFSSPDVVEMDSRLNSFNMLTGTLEMSLKNAMLFNTIGYLVAMIFVLIADKIIPCLNWSIVMIVFVGWFVAWSAYYIVKAESLKQLIVYWLDQD